MSLRHSMERKRKRSRQSASAPPSSGRESNLGGWNLFCRLTLRPLKISKLAHWGCSRFRHPHSRIEYLACFFSLCMFMRFVDLRIFRYPLMFMRKNRDRCLTFGREWMHVCFHREKRIKTINECSLVYRRISSTKLGIYHFIFFPPQWSCYFNIFFNLLMVSRPAAQKTPMRGKWVCSIPQHSSDDAGYIHHSNTLIGVLLFATITSSPALSSRPLK